MSDGLKGMMKNGWHPKGKDGGRESWRGDFKGINQVAGWVGKGKSSDSQAARDHTSRPLSSLKDPASFGPPPKNVNFHGGAALPNEITPHRSGLGAPLKLAQTASANQSMQEEEEEEPSKLAPPALPYRANTTGLRTDNLPPPPVRGDVSQAGPPLPPARSPAPKPPPRLPARQNTTSSVEEPPPPSYDAVVPQPASSPYINQSAVRNLSKAGIKVPGLGIGGNNESNPWKDERSQAQTPGRNQLSELQSRFSRMNTTSEETGAVSSNAPAPAPSKTSMPSWQQSQSAFSTAQNLRANPQNVSMADAQNAAQTANQAHSSVNAFRERHADSIANAQAKAKAWDQKYKVTSKINKFLDEHTDPDTAQQQQQQPPPPQQQQLSHTSEYVSPPPVPQHPNVVQQPGQSPPAVDLSAASISRKPPPPPAPRKPANLQAPPPVPKATKPSFG